MYKAISKLIQNYLNRKMRIQECRWCVNLLEQRILVIFRFKMIFTEKLSEAGVAVKKIDLLKPSAKQH